MLYKSIMVALSVHGTLASRFTSLGPESNPIMCEVTKALRSRSSRTKLDRTSVEAGAIVQICPAKCSINGSVWMLNRVRAKVEVYDVEICTVRPCIEGSFEGPYLRVPSKALRTIGATLRNAESYPTDTLAQSVLKAEGILQMCMEAALINSDGVSTDTGDIRSKGILTAVTRSTAHRIVRGETMPSPPKGKPVSRAERVHADRAEALDIYMKAVGMTDRVMAAKFLDGFLKAPNYQVATSWKHITLFRTNKIRQLCGLKKFTPEDNHGVVHGRLSNSDAGTSPANTSHPTAESEF